MRDMEGMGGMGIIFSENSWGFEGNGLSLEKTKRLWQFFSNKRVITES